MEPKNLKTIQQNLEGDDLGDYVIFRARLPMHTFQSLDVEVQNSLLLSVQDWLKRPSVPSRLKGYIVGFVQPIALPPIAHPIALQIVEEFEYAPF